MALGEKLKQARLEAGLSQRQLCAGNITRNMLSQIENGSARPSMATLQYLAGRLGKPISWFLEETAVTSSNQPAMAAARAAWKAGDAAATAQALSDYRGPDPVFDAEYASLQYVSTLALARQALGAGKDGYARQLLAQAEATGSPYIKKGADFYLLLAQADPARLQEAAQALDLDGSLIVKAQACLETDPQHSVRLLHACERPTARWELTMGLARMALGEYELAALHLRRAEDTCPAQVIPKLEQCYRELRDFEKAYEYACKQR